MLHTFLTIQLIAWTTRLILLALAIDSQMTDRNALPISNPQPL